jgi:hypothetical protein
VAPSLLSLVHGIVCLFKQLLNGLVVVGVKLNLPGAEVNRAPHFFRTGVGFYPICETDKTRPGRSRRRSCEQHREFITAKPAHDITLSEHLGKTLCKCY